MSYTPTCDWHEDIQQRTNQCPTHSRPFSIVIEWFSCISTQTYQVYCEYLPVCMKCTIQRKTLCIHLRRHRSYMKRSILLKHTHILSFTSSRVSDFMSTYFIETVTVMRVSKEIHVPVIFYICHATSTFVTCPKVHLPTPVYVKHIQHFWADLSGLLVYFSWRPIPKHSLSPLRKPFALGGVSQAPCPRPLGLFAFFSCPNPPVLCSEQQFRRASPHAEVIGLPDNLLAVISVSRAFDIQEVLWVRSDVQCSG